MNIHIYLSLQKFTCDFILGPNITPFHFQKCVNRGFGAVFSTNLTVEETFLLLGHYNMGFLLAQISLGL